MPRRFPRAGSLRRLVREILDAYRVRPRLGGRRTATPARVAIAMEDQLIAREVNLVELASPGLLPGQGGLSRRDGSRPTGVTSRWCWR